jgi:hypothetical protein
VNADKKVFKAIFGEFHQKSLFIRVHLWQMLIYKTLSQTFEQNCCTDCLTSWLTAVFPHPCASPAGRGVGARVKNRLIKKVKQFFNQNTLFSGEMQYLFIAISELS